MAVLLVGLFLTLSRRFMNLARLLAMEAGRVAVL